MAADRVDKGMAGISGKGCSNTCLLMDDRMLPRGELSGNRVVVRETTDESCGWTWG